MKFSTCVAVVLVATGFSCVSESGCLPIARAEEITPASRIEKEYLADLARPHSNRVFHAVSYFLRSKTPATKVIPIVLPLLKITTNDRNENRRLFHLAELLEYYGPQAKSAIPQLIEIAAKAKQKRTRERSRIALAKIGPNDERVFAALTKNLRVARAGDDQG